MQKLPPCTFYDVLEQLGFKKKRIKFASFTAGSTCAFQSLLDKGSTSARVHPKNQILIRFFFPPFLLNRCDAQKYTVPRPIFQMSFTMLRSIWPYCALQAISDIYLASPPIVPPLFQLSRGRLTIFTHEFADGKEGEMKDRYLRSALLSTLQKITEKKKERKKMS